MNSEGQPADADATMSFEALGLPPALVRVLREIGYETPSPIQAATIPVLLDGRDVLGMAQTGTGKTAAFALPILARIDARAKLPQALVLAPTRELALQVAEAFEKYSAHLRGLHVLPVYGGQAYGIQLSALRRGVQVVVGTPGRIIDHLDRGTLDLSELRYLVLDEADEMLTMGFAEEVEAILARTPEDKQVALFSATMPAPIRRLTAQYLRDPQEIAIARTATTAANINQRWLLVSHHQKVDALTRILEVENFDGMIAFVRTKQSTEQLAERLRARGLNAVALNGDVPQAQRERTVNQFRDGKLDILVATDVAARGLDVERVSHVVNVDIPTDPEAYVHRIGRTGRAGRSGEAISFVTPRERYLLNQIEKATRQKLAQMQLPSVEDINATRLARFDDAITQALDSDRLDFFREVVAHYVQEFDVPELDVAAALALASQGEEPMLLDPAAEPAPPTERDRGRGPRRSDLPMATYRLDVGRRQRVDPRQIVGALANEGGLRREHFGRIDIKSDFSLIELPADLPPGTLDKLRGTRISGVLINLQPDRGRRGARFAKDGPRGKDRRGDRPNRPTREGGPRKSRW